VISIKRIAGILMPVLLNIFSIFCLLKAAIMHKDIILQIANRIKEKRRKGYYTAGTRW
jgi:hypothetical protein